MKKILKVNPIHHPPPPPRVSPPKLKIVLNYYGIEKTEEELAQLMKWDKDLGVDDNGIKEVAESLGFNVEIKNNSNFNDIEEWLDKEIPIIVDWFTTGRSDYPESSVCDGHYSVVAGIDDKYIYLQDPEIGHVRKVEKDDFESVWFDFTGENIHPNELIIRQIIAIYK